VNTNAGAPRLVVPEDWVRDLDEETAAAWARYASHLPERLLAPRAQIFDNAVTLQAYEANAIHAKALRENPSRFNPDVQERLRFGSTIEGAAAAAAANSLSRLAGDIDSRLSPGELIALPTTACVAPRLDEPDPREPLTRFTRPFSGTGHPAISIPLPSTGMPVGIQLVARRGDDAWLIEGAAAVEQLLSNGDVL
jgi:aspartyl-tRNA(Asn)/glutamyl-tRNA(Gln) amidotransferase subunit A